jgi:bifunctional oligoribonuclease and PAP phosphatase NrnA
MNGYATNATFAQVAGRIAQAKSIMVTTHAKPDGDAVGAALALTRALQGMGKQADMFFAGPIEPPLYKTIGDTPFRKVEHQPPAGGDAYDLVVILDTGSWPQLEPLAEYLKPRRERIVVIDHHPTGDADLGSMRIVDPSSAASSQIVAALLDEMGIALTGGAGGIAEALFVGLATDTGWFKYANAGPEAFALAARLLECGVDKPRLYQIIEENYEPRRLALEARALTSLEFARGGSAAIQLLRPADFAVTGGRVEDLTGLVNTPLTVGKIRVSILLSQTPDNQGSASLSKPPVTKISFRSKAAPPEGSNDDFVDVNALAARFGGGGHVFAAGARVNMDIDQARAAVIKAL